MNITEKELSSDKIDNENDIELDVEPTLKNGIHLPNLLQKDILASDSGSVSSRANNTSAIKQELHDVNLRF